MKENLKSLDWDIEKIANALKISSDDVKQYFTDGRRISFILERRIAKEFFGGKIADSEGANFDFIDLDGKKWEVRSITKGGVYFCPSYMVGSSRCFEEKGFLDKLYSIEGYILCDITTFPNVPFWIISAETVEQWWRSGKLKKDSKIIRHKILTLIENLAPEN